MTASRQRLAVLSLALWPQPLTAAAPKALVQLQGAAGLSALETSAELVTGRATPLSEPSPAPARAPNLCYARALKDLKLTAYGAVSLCSGASSESAPLDCYRAALGANLSSVGAVLLCAGAAAEAAPVECYRKSSGLGLTALGAVTLCHAARNADEPWACFEKAQEAGLTAYGAVQLCGGIPVELHKQVYGDRKETPPLLR